MSYTARACILQEASLSQARELKANVAVLPWGATEAHNYHLPHGTDTLEASGLAEAAVISANAQGARCIVLPAVPFGNNNQQLPQACTITMRSMTQHAVLRDVAESLVRQKIDRLVVYNFHGGNDFKQSIRDIMLDVPIFIVQVNGWQVSPQMRDLLAVKTGDHADEFETSLMLHMKGEWVAGLERAGDGGTTASKLPAISGTPGVWCPRDWAAFTKDTGAGDPRAATTEKGRKIFELLVNAFVAVLVQLSSAKEGDFPFVIRRP
jgi:creatinine amidohydrolase